MSQKQNLSKKIGMVVGVFAAVGVSLDLTGYISVGWIQGAFTNPDQGEFANSIGQMFVGLVLFQRVIITFFTGPTGAAITGLLSGLFELSRTRSAGSPRPEPECLTIEVPFSFRMPAVVTVYYKSGLA